MTLREAGKGIVTTGGVHIVLVIMMRTVLKQKQK